MKTFLRALVAAGGLAACLAFTPHAFGRSEPEPAGAANLSDPAFDAYVDPALLGRAWADHDPALLADAGLQLAEGERVLMRTHKSGIDAETLLELAAKVAADRHDKATLDRLAKAAERQGRKALAGQVAIASKLGGQARSLDPTLMISVDDTTPEVFGLFRQGVGEVETARLAGGRVALDDADKRLADVKRFLPKPQADALAKLSAEARAALPADDQGPDMKSDRLATTLKALAAESRDVGNDRRDAGAGRPDVGTDRQARIRGRLAGPSRDTPSTFDDPDPAVWGNGRPPAARPPAARPPAPKVSFSVLNTTDYNVAFYLNNTLMNLPVGQTQTYWMTGQGSFVRVMQVGGGYQDFSVQNGGSYQFQMDGNGQIVNAYR